MTTSSIGRLVSVAIVEVFGTTISETLGLNPSTLTFLSRVVRQQGRWFTPCNLQKSGPDTGDAELVTPHLLGLGPNPSAGNSINPSRLCCETLSYGANGVSQALFTG